MSGTAAPTVPGARSTLCWFFRRLGKADPAMGVLFMLGFEALALSESSYPAIHHIQKS
jgi:hypothetical protein